MGKHAAKTQTMLGTHAHTPCTKGLLARLLLLLAVVCWCCLGACAAGVYTAGSGGLTMEYFKLLSAPSILLPTLRRELLLLELQTLARSSN